MSRTVADFMSSPPLTVNPETPLSEALQLLAQQKITGLPVVDGQGQLVGVISDTDLMWQETGADPPPYIVFLDSVIFLQNPARYEHELHKAIGQTVGEVMSSIKVTTQPEQSLHEAAKLMHKERVRRLPVVNANHDLVGILTHSDIIRAMAGV
ncbi:MAG: CBS domain-containing protein [Spirulina sp. SIO3F2]|nr:CBS domain-containing protein [Spirulina sp. SIO3F2]